MDSGSYPREERGEVMFSVQQKREISEAVQQILAKTNHPELPADGEIQFQLTVYGASQMSWATIRNNGAIENPSVNPWNETQDPESKVSDENHED